VEEKKKKRVGIPLRYLLVVAGGLIGLVLVGLVALAVIVFDWETDAGKPMHDTRQVTRDRQSKGPNEPEASIPDEGLLLGRHGQPLVSLAISSTGRLAASGGGDRSIRLWDLRTGKELHRFEGLSADPLSVAFSPDEKRLLATSGNTLHEWSLRDRKPVGATGRPGSRLTPDGRSVLFLDLMNGRLTARVFDTAGGQERGQFPAGDAFLHDLTLSADGKRLLLLAGTNIQLVELQPPKELCRLAGRGVEQVSTAVCPAQGRQAVMGGHKGGLWLVDVNEGRVVRTFQGAHNGSVECLALSPDGSRAASGGLDGTIRLWNPAEGTGTGQLEGHAGGVTRLAYTPDGRLLSAGRNGDVWLWDLSKARPAAPPANLPPPPTVEFSSVRPDVPVSGEVLKLEVGSGAETCAVSPDGRRAAVAENTRLLLCDLVAGKVTNSVDRPGIRFRGLCFTPDGNQVLAVEGDGTLRLWEFSSGKEVRTFEGRHPRPQTVAVSADGRFAACGGGGRLVGFDAAGGLGVWETATGKLVFYEEGDQQSLRSLTFTADGTQIVSSSDDRTLRVWNAANGKQEKVIRIRPWFTGRVSMSPDGRHFLVPRLGIGYIREATLEREVGAAGDTWNQMKDVAFCGNNRVVTASGVQARVGGTGSEADGRLVWANNLLRLWDLETGKELKRFEGHTDVIKGVFCSTDGRRAVSLSADGTVRVWDLAGTE
jgi:WD40 repeat protein